RPAGARSGGGGEAGGLRQSVRTGERRGASPASGSDRRRKAVSRTETVRSGYDADGRPRRSAEALPGDPEDEADRALYGGLGAGTGRAGESGRAEWEACLPAGAEGRDGSDSRDNSRSFQDDGIGGACNDRGCAGRGEGVEQ